MKHETLKKLAASGMMVALIIVLSGFYIPVGASKCFPVQHMMNILSADRSGASASRSARLSYGILWEPEP